MTVTLSVSLKRHFEMREKFPCKYIDEKKTRRLCQNRPLNTVAFAEKNHFPYTHFFAPKTIQPFILFPIRLYIKKIKMNSSHSKPFICERFGAGTADIHQT